MRERVKERLSTHIHLAAPPEEEEEEEEEE